MKRRFSLLGALFAVAFGALALAIESQHYEGSWGGMLVFALGFPTSIAGLLLGGIFGPAGFWLVVLCGAFQWYLIGMLVQGAVMRRPTQIDPAKENPDANTKP